MNTPDTNTTPRDPSPAQGRNVLLAVTGGIAAYKSAALVSQLAQAGAQVRVAMTRAATRFVAPLTFESLSGAPVITSAWSKHRNTATQHIALARWCDIMAIAPASADTLAKLAAGTTDDIVSLLACALPAETPLLLAPAMNADMWTSPINQRNVNTLTDLLNARFVGPDHGWQSCRTTGPGRMSEPDAILTAIASVLSN